MARHMIDFDQLAIRVSLLMGDPENLYLYKDIVNSLDEESLVKAKIASAIRVAVRTDQELVSLVPTRVRARVAESKIHPFKFSKKVAARAAKRGKPLTEVMIKSLNTMAATGEASYSGKPVPKYAIKGNNYRFFTKSVEIEVDDALVYDMSFVLGCHPIGLMAWNNGDLNAAFGAL